MSASLSTCVTQGCDTKLNVRLLEKPATGLAWPVCSDCRRRAAHGPTRTGPAGLFAQDRSNRRPSRNANRSKKGS